MPVNRRMPRIQAVILPVLRAELDDEWPGLKVGSWIESVAKKNGTVKRTFPMLNIRRLGGLSRDARLLDRPVIEMTAYTASVNGGNLEATEELYLDAREILWNMVRKQKVVPGAGHLHSFFETMGPTQFDSPFDDTFRVQGLIQLGLRPSRN